MKKTNFFLGMALFAMIGFSSCKDEVVVVSSAVTVATKDSATITGYVTADLNLQTAGLEAVPAGTVLLVSLPYSSLNASATGKWQKTVIVDVAGKYIVKVPTNNVGVTVTFIPLSFDADQTQAYAGGAVVPTVKWTYSIAPFSQNVVSGQIVPLNINYTPNFGIAIDLPKVQISGKAQAEMNDSIIGLENLPNGTKIIFYANVPNSWVDSTTVQNGIYSISVPKNIQVYWDIKKFTYLMRSFNPSATTDKSKYFYTSVSKEYSFPTATSGAGGFSSNMTKNITPTGATPTELYYSTVVSGKAQAEIDQTNIITPDDLPNGTEISFYTTTWGAKAIVQNGRYTVNVPFNSTISFYYKVDNKSAANVITGQVYQGSFNNSSSKTLTGNINGNTYTIQ